MSKTDPKPLGTGGISHQMVETALDLFVDKLLRHAGDMPEQRLESQEIAEFARSFKSNGFNGVVGPTQKLLNDWLARHQADLKKQNRRQPFERIIVERFAALFPPGESLQDELGISRRVLPGLFRQFKALGGEKLLDQCQGAALGIFEQVRKEYGPDFRWKHFYHNVEANLLVDELMIVMAWRFQDFDLQFQTFMEQINKHLAAPEPYAYEGAGVETWSLTEARALAILWLMFEPYTQKLKDAEERDRITKQFGDKAEQALEHVIQNLQDRLDKE